MVRGAGFLSDLFFDGTLTKRFVVTVQDELKLRLFDNKIYLKGWDL